MTFKTLYPTHWKSVSKVEHGVLFLSALSDLEDYLNVYQQSCNLITITNKLMDAIDENIDECQSQLQSVDGLVNDGIKTWNLLGEDKDNVLNCFKDNGTLPHNIPEGARDYLRDVMVLKVTNELRIQCLRVDRILHMESMDLACTDVDIASDKGISVMQTLAKMLNVLNLNNVTRQYVAGYVAGIGSVFNQVL